MHYPREIEHDLEVYFDKSIGDWMQGRMTSRKLLMYLDGLLADSRSVNGWYAKAVRMDYQEMEKEKAEAAERLARAEQRAQCLGQPLSMADLQPQP